MAFYSEELIEEVRSRNDIVDVVSGYVKLQKRGGSYFGLCPFHNEKTGSFSVSPGKQMYHCFGCGAGGDVLNFVMEYENFTFPEAMGHLARRVGIELPKQEMDAKSRQESDQRAKLLAINKAAAKYFYVLLRQEQGKCAMEYLVGRELTSETIQRFGLGYASKYSDGLYRYLRQQGYEDGILKESGLVTIDERRGGYDKFWNRAMFPIMDANSRVIGFGGRVMGEGEPKYLNSPETKIFDKSRNLYGLNFARSSRRPQILLCEGYLDVIALHQAGFDNAVASLGTSFTSGHAGLLKRYTKEVYLTFDSDGAGQRAALRAIPLLKEVGLMARVVRMEPYKDPDEFIKGLGAEAFQERMDQAQNSFLFEIEALEQEFDLKDPQGKTSFFNEAARRLTEFEQELERENYIEAIAAKYQVGVDRLRKLVNHMGAGMGGAPPRRPLKSGASQGRKQESGMDKSQRLLLTWLIEDQRLFDVVRPYISPEDFTDAVCQRAARLLFQQYEEGDVSPARILRAFPEEEQREAASLFHARLDEIETRQEREKALKETILRVKNNSIADRSKRMDPADVEGFQKLMQDKLLLQEIQRLHISME